MAPRTTVRPYAQKENGFFTVYNASDRGSTDNLTTLHIEDNQFDWRLRPSNFPTSRDVHHRPPAIWAGELQQLFGEHRRGPSRRERYL